MRTHGGRSRGTRACSCYRTQAFFQAAGRILARSDQPDWAGRHGISELPKRAASRFRFCPLLSAFVPSRIENSMQRTHRGLEERRAGCFSVVFTGGFNEKWVHVRSLRRRARYCSVLHGFARLNQKSGTTKPLLGAADGPKTKEPDLLLARDTGDASEFFFRIPGFPV
jgi:hypothetical protein